MSEVPSLREKFRDTFVGTLTSVQGRLRTSIAMRPSRVLALLPHPLTLLSLFALTVLVTPRDASAQALSGSPAESRSLHLLDPKLEPSPRTFTFPSDERREAWLDDMGMHLYAGYYGLTRGAIHGALLTFMLDVQGEGAAALIGLGAVGETVAAIALTSEWTPGRAHLIGTGLDFGLIAGLGVDLAGTVTFDWDRADRSQLFFAIPLVLSVSGALATAQLVDASNLTWGDMELMHTTGLVGAVLGASGLGRSDPLAGVGLLTGSAVGLLAGGFLISDRDFSLTQSLLMDLAVAVGGTAGGVTAGAAGGSYQAVGLSAGLGALVGLAITYPLLSPDAHAQEQKPPVAVSLQFSPGSLASRDTQTGRPQPTSLMLQGRF